MGGFCLLVELHQEGSAPAACAAGLFICLTQNPPVMVVVSELTGCYSLESPGSCVFRSPGCMLREINHRGGTALLAL